jgi:hypothetical protein
MKKAFLLILISLMLSCTTHVQDQGIPGTWIYTVEDAPIGFQTGRVIFYKENDSLKVKLKVYGIPIEAANLEIDGTKISFTTQIEHEQISIKLEKKEDELVGMVLASEGGMPISLEKKGWRSREREYKIFNR